MSFFLNQLLICMKPRPLTLIPMALLVLTVSGCLLSSKPSEEKLINKLNSQLMAERFEQLYEEAGDFLRLNVTKEKFVQRMKMAVAKLKTIDENLNFQRDKATERFLEDLRGNEKSVLITVAQTLEKDGNSVTVLSSWDMKGKFFDLSVSPNSGTSEQYQVWGVSYKHLRQGGRIID